MARPTAGASAPAALPNDEGAEDHASDHQPDGGLSKHGGHAFNSLVRGIEARDDFLGAVEEALGRLDRRFKVPDSAVSCRHDHPFSLWFISILADWQRAGITRSRTNVAGDVAIEGLAERDAMTTAVRLEAPGVLGRRRQRLWTPSWSAHGRPRYRTTSIGRGDGLRRSHTTEHDPAGDDAHDAAEEQDPPAAAHGLESSRPQDLGASGLVTSMVTSMRWVTPR
jgi:hypothetical protein